jgi:rod shape-determining protein MreD
MRNLIAFPILLLAVILQVTLVSRIQLLSGYADLPLVLLIGWALQERVTTAWHWAFVACLFLGFVSGLPIAIIIVGYVFVIYIAQILQRSVWQAPLLAMFAVTFLGTIFINFLSFFVLSFLGTPLPFADVLSLIILPSLLLNMLLAIPVYAWMRDLSAWVFPEDPAL